MSKKAVTNTVLFLFFVVVIATMIVCLNIRYEDITDIFETDDGLVIVNGEAYEVVR